MIQVPCSRECTQSVSPSTLSKQIFFLFGDVRNKLSFTSIWCELKNKSNAVFTFLVAMRDVYEETTKPRHYTYISSALWLQQTEIRFVEKKVSWNEVQIIINTQYLLSCRFFLFIHSIERVRGLQINYTKYILYPRDFIGNPKRKTKIFVFNFCVSRTIYCNVGVQFNDKPLHIRKTFLKKTVHQYIYHY